MTLRSAVVGAGVVSERHLTGLDRNPRTELVAVCDLDADRADEKALGYGIKAYTDLAEMLERERLDWVHVCTPVGTHVPLALQAIEAGVPVLIEKPVAETVAEVEELAAASREAGVTVSVVHNHVFSPVMRKLRERLADGDLGDVRGVDLLYTGSTAPDTPNRGAWAFDLLGGEFEEGLPHSLSIALRVAGYPRSRDEVSAHTALAGEYEGKFGYDGAQVGYVTDDEVIVNATVLSGTVPVRVLYVHGTETTLVADEVSQTLVTLDRDYKGSSVGRALNNVDQAFDRMSGTVENAVALLRRARDGSWEQEAETNSMFYQFDREIDALLTGGDPATPIEEAKWTIALIEAIRDSVDDGDPVSVADVAQD
ncbi:Gfo/Idh/MocA family oxidoreductase [Halorubrum sp. AD140]|uniref:Gfo/Idh/MocA family protein n=1 Tax=Halorubrum sp. AD140 TaxID=3050073 RepID=UPI002ACC897D|nr:Gfo/Idh/MocA family oxidoreductase [Halorubrum sp. AD140]MDZ5810250.1 Gfo/Idh/MocA family oxidoreductase [Halorubrum sp. AD140]